ncbi:heterokaryon incompatibility protein-domain-containing protein [Phyllosticta capitalensis]
MSNNYQYTKLATPSTIRVIKLEEQKVDNIITCIIRHVEQSKFEYHALSYVWGDPTPTRKIYLGSSGDQSSIFTLHENLWRFLDWAWNRQMFDRWIWTDGISLNQADHNEISQQVPRMGEIFQNARLVMAWLGMSKKEGEQIMPLLSMQSFNHRDIAQPLKMWNQLSSETKDSALTAYYNEYWQRLWIVQEVAMARSLVILIGDIEVSMDDYVSKFRIAQMEISRKFPWGVEGPASFKSGNEKLELWRVLILLSHGNYKCKETNDRVYGGLGLAAYRPDGSSPLDFIEVDYSKPFGEVNIGL